MIRKTSKPVLIFVKAFKINVLGLIGRFFTSKICYQAWLVLANLLEQPLPSIKTLILKAYKNW